MKELLSIFIVFIVGGFTIATAQQSNGESSSEGFHLVGNIDGLDTNEMSLLYKITDTNMISETSKITDGEFSFTGHVPYPSTAILKSSDRSIETRIYLENKKIVIRGTLNEAGMNIDVEGSKTQDDAEALQKATSKILKKRRYLTNQLRKASANKDEEKAKSIRKELSFLMKEENKIIRQFIKDHPDSFFSLYELKKLTGDADLAVIHQLFNELGATIRNSKPGQKYGIKLKKRIRAKAVTAIGNEALNFTQKNVQGKSISLTDFRGQYVLIDFWASWCGPCREENPNVVTAYQNYRDKAFTVLGVSLDTNREEWLKAIEEDNLTCTQISDLKGWENQAAQLYGIRAIPANFLINPEGVIIAKNLRGDELNSKLEEIFN